MLAALLPVACPQQAPRHADVVVFDPEHCAPMADYVHPRGLSRGVDHLLVNGRPAIADGKLAGIATGRVRPHTPTSGTCP